MSEATLMARARTEFSDQMHFQVLFDASDICGKPTEFYQAGASTQQTRKTEAKD